MANELALTLVEIGEDERKRQFTLAEATYRQQHNAETAATLGWVCYRLGRMGGTERMFNAVASANPFSPDAAYFFATLPTTAIAATVPRACSKRLLKRTRRSRSPRQGAEVVRSFVERDAATPAKIDVKPPAETAKPTKAAPKSEGAKASASDQGQAGESRESLV